jgi:hypothetical protein
MQTVLNKRQITACAYLKYTPRNAENKQIYKYYEWYDGCVSSCLVNL